MLLPAACLLTRRSIGRQTAGRAGQGNGAAPPNGMLLLQAGKGVDSVGKLQRSSRGFKWQKILPPHSSLAAAFRLPPPPKHGTAQRSSSQRAAAWWLTLPTPGTTLKSASMHSSISDVTILRRGNWRHSVWMPSGAAIRLHGMQQEGHGMRLAAAHHIRATRLHLRIFAFILPSLASQPGPHLRKRILDSSTPLLSSTCAVTNMGHPTDTGGDVEPNTQQVIYN